MKNVIYIWENKVNGKAYVGQAKDFEKRTKGHILAAMNPNTKNLSTRFHSTLRKHGASGFEVYPLEAGLDCSELDKKESHWIRVFYSDLTGYNSTPGNYQKAKDDKQEHDLRKQLFRSEVKDGKMRLLPASKGLKEELHNRAGRRDSTNKLISAIFEDKSSFEVTRHCGRRRLHCQICIPGTSTPFAYVDGCLNKKNYQLVVRVPRNRDFFQADQHQGFMKGSGFYVKHIGRNWSYYGYTVPFVDSTESDIARTHRISISEFLDIAMQEQSFLEQQEREQSTTWTFSPYNLKAWNQSESRIMVVGPEPPMEKPGIKNLDTGEWFRTAANKNKFHGYRTFYNRCNILVDGIMGKTEKTNFNHFRYLSLKATAGNFPANEKGIESYVEQIFDKVLEPFLSDNPRTGLAPHIVVVLGSISREVFDKKIKPGLVERNSGIRCVYMTHPLRGGMINRHVETMAGEVQEKLLPVSATINRWHCWGRMRGGEWITQRQAIEVAKRVQERRDWRRLRE